MKEANLENIVYDLSKIKLEPNERLLWSIECKDGTPVSREQMEIFRRLLTRAFESPDFSIVIPTQLKVTKKEIK